jgi:hypothetical protein
MKLELVASAIQHKPILLAISLVTDGSKASKQENLLSFQNIERLEKPHLLSTIVNLRLQLD